MKQTRIGVVYLAVVYHPKTGKMGNGYVGQTRQRPAARWKQHERGFLDSAGRWNPPQPWADTIIEWVILWKGEVTDAGLDKKEQHFIRKMKPVYNYCHNLSNPHRITMAEAQRLRRQRDMGVYPRGFKRRALGVPGLITRWLGLDRPAGRIWRDERGTWQRSGEMFEEEAS